METPPRYTIKNVIPNSIDHLSETQISDILNKDNRPICKFFLTNSCTFGDKCTNLHTNKVKSAKQSGTEPSNKSSAKSSPKPDTEPKPGLEPESKSNKICSFWKQGTCKFGNTCQNSHIDTHRIEKSNNICRFYKNGTCKFGDTCRDSHENNSVPLCKNHSNGNYTCKFGDGCKFIHEKSPAKEERGEGEKIPCKFFSSGACKFGDNCRHAHT